MSTPAQVVLICWSAPVRLEMAVHRQDVPQATGLYRIRRLVLGGGTTSAKRVPAT